MGAREPSLSDSAASSVTFGEGQESPSALFWSFAVGFALLTGFCFLLPKLKSTEPAAASGMPATVQVKADYEHVGGLGRVVVIKSPNAGPEAGPGRQRAGGRVPVENRVEVRRSEPDGLPGSTLMYGP